MKRPPLTGLVVRGLKQMAAETRFILLADYKRLSAKERRELRRALEWLDATEYFHFNALQK